MRMQRRSGPAAALSGERLVFAVRTRPADQAVTWSGGGDPATGSGRRFATRFAAGGTYTVTARSGDVQVDFPVTVCPVDTWLRDAEAFYGPAVDLSRVTIKSSRAVAGPAWTCNDVIRFKRPREAQGLPSQSTLIHELAHVWQHQRGGMQLLRGLVEQTGRRLGRDPYDYGGPERLRTARHILEFRNEGQAEIVMELWRSQHGYRKDHRGRPFSSEYVDDLRRLVEGAGIGTSATTTSGIMAPLPGLMAVPPPGIGAATDRVVARVVNAIADLVG
jgi:Domain of unknown function (DUF4157)